MKKIVFLVVAVLVTCLNVNARLAAKMSKERKAVQRYSVPQVKMERIAKVTKATNARFNPNLVPVKEVLSSRKLKDGSELRIVRLENGVVRKQFLKAEEKLQRKITRPGKSSGNAGLRASASSEALDEGFEGWDEEAWDWLPEGWTDESKAGSISHLVDVYGDTYNFTWRTAHYYPKSGLYSAYVQYAFPVDTLSDEDENGDGLLNDTIQCNLPTPQDEWLISPPVTVKQADYVFVFDLYYDPFWGRLSYLEIDENNELIAAFDTMHTVVEALISTDGGNTWTKKWDNRENAAQYTDDELLDIGLITGAPWLMVSIDLAEYHNKDIQIAIRYWDDGGESVFVDNVKVGYLLPEVSYRRPSGHLISGLSTDYLALTGNVIVGHAYTPTLWKGEVKYQESVSWSFSDADLAPIESYSEQNPVVTLPFGLYNTPLLTATGKGNTRVEFQLGSDGEYSLIGLGGENIWLGENDEEIKLGLGNYDLQYGLAFYTGVNAEGMVDYGTFKGVANYFEKPASKYMFETFYVHLGNIVPKPDEPVKLNIYAVNENNSLGEIIASSETWPEDFIFAYHYDEEDDDGDVEGTDLYTIPFKFMAIDSEGREHESYLEIDDRFVAEFYNYQSADILFQYEDHPTGENYAYISLEEGLVSLNATSALFDMDAAFPFLHTEDNRYEAPVTGGTKSFEISTYWLPDGWWLDENLPDWISFGEPSTDFTAGIVTLPVVVDALPSTVSGRSANIYIASYACNLTLQIKQGSADWARPTGITTVKANRAKEVKVVRQGDRFVLSYPAGTTSVAVYNAAGQRIAEYALNPSGTYSIPAARLPKGIYILKFAGKTNEAVKVVK